MPPHFFRFIIPTKQKQIFFILLSNYFNSDRNKCTVNYYKFTENAARFNL